MAFWLAIPFGLAVGAIAGGRTALSWARRDEIESANRWLRISALVAAITAMIVVSLLIKWPFVAETVSVPEEVKKKVIETVSVPVEVTKWLVFSDTEMKDTEIETEVVETVHHDETHYRFSILMLVPWLLVGWLAYLGELWIIRLAWRFWG